MKTRREYRGYFIVCDGSMDLIKVVSQADELMRDDFKNTREARAFIDPIADCNDAALRFVIDSLGIEKNNVILMENYR